MDPRVEVGIRVKPVAPAVQPDPPCTTKRLYEVLTVRHRAIPGVKHRQVRRARFSESPEAGAIVVIILVVSAGCGNDDDGCVGPTRQLDEPVDDVRGRCSPSAHDEGPARGPNGLGTSEPWNGRQEQQHEHGDSGHTSENGGWLDHRGLLVRAIEGTAEIVDLEGADFQPDYLLEPPVVWTLNARGPKLVEGDRRQTHKSAADQPSTERGAEKMRLPGVCLITAACLAVGAEEAMAQNRSFSEEPDVLLGLREDRSPSLTFVDVDGDGDLDVLVANGRHWPQRNEVFLNNGRGRFTIGYFLGEELSTSYAVPAGDLDGDGDPDVVVANDQAPNQIYLNDGSGRFSLAGSLGPEVESTRGVVLADLDRDGMVDVLVTNRGMENGIHLNRGGGKFSEKRGFGTSDDSTISLAVADLNTDGFPDLVLANRDGQPNAVYLSDSALGFHTSLPFGTGSDETRAVAVADMDGDGRLDLVTVNIGEANGVYLGDGNGRFVDVSSFGEPGGRSYSVAVTDLDRDGDPDIVVGNVGARNAVYFNDGSGRRFSVVRFGGATDVTYGVAVGDVDGDGFPDIGVANSDGLNGIHLNRPAENR